MKRELHKAALAVLAALFVVFAVGCESLPNAGKGMEPLENFGGGGGD